MVAYHIAIHRVFHADAYLRTVARLSFSICAGSIPVFGALEFEGSKMTTSSGEANYLCLCCHHFLIATLCLQLKCCMMQRWSSIIAILPLSLWFELVASSLLLHFHFFCDLRFVFHNMPPFHFFIDIVTMPCPMLAMREYGWPRRYVHGWSWLVRLFVALLLGQLAGRVSWWACWDPTPADTIPRSIFDLAV